jgi:hypothetical protein
MRRHGLSYAASCQGDAAERREAPERRRPLPRDARGCATPEPSGVGPGGRPAGDPLAAFDAALAATADAQNAEREPSSVRTGDGRAQPMECLHSFRDAVV